MQNGIKAVIAVLGALALLLGLAFLQAKGDIRSLNGDIRTYTETVDEKEQEIDVLTLAAADSASTIETLNADIADKDAQIEALNADVADKDAQIETLNADIANKDAQIETLNADIADRDAQIETLNADAADKDAQIEALSADVADKDAQIEALSTQLTALPEPEDLGDPAEGRFANTRRITLRLQENGIPYSFDDSGDDDVISIRKDSISANGVPFSYTLGLYLEEDNSSAAFIVWNLIDYDEKDTAAVRQVCDELNYTWRWIRLNTDPTDDSVTCSRDCVLADCPEAGDILWATLEHIDSLLSLAYDDLAPYAK